MWLNSERISQVLIGSGMLLSNFWPDSEWRAARSDENRNLSKEVLPGSGTWNHIQSKMWQDLERTHGHNWNHVFASFRIRTGLAGILQSRFQNWSGIRDLNIYRSRSGRKFSHARLDEQQHGKIYQELESSSVKNRHFPIVEQWNSVYYEEVSRIGTNT